MGISCAGAKPAATSPPRASSGTCSSRPAIRRTQTPPSAATSAATCSAAPTACGSTRWARSGCRPTSRRPPSTRATTRTWATPTSVPSIPRSACSAASSPARAAPRSPASIPRRTTAPPSSISSTRERRRATFPIPPARAPIPTGQTMRPTAGRARPRSSSGGKMAESSAPSLLWQPGERAVEEAQVTQFARQVIRKRKLDLNSYPDFYRWTVDNPEEFWTDVWDFCGVIGKRGAAVLVDGGKMPGASWFPEARLNFAENLMRRGDRGDAFVLWDETGFRRRLSFSDLTSEVSRAEQALRALGLRAGDRAAAFIPNIPEAGMLALAATSQGMVWSSCSPDFGVEGVVERFGQIEPKVLFCADGYRYNGEEHDSLARVAEIVDKLPSVRKVIVVPHLDPQVDVSGVPKAVRLDEWLRRYTPGDIAFAQLPFDHPVYILFTSGTTGKPKCIVHGAGGSLLAGLKMHKLQMDIRPGDRYFYFCTTNWVVWNLLFGALGAEASVMLYDGSPFARNAKILFDYAEKEKFTHLGTSPKFLDAIAKRGLEPRTTHDLAALRMLVSTGSPLAPEGFDYVYEKVKSEVVLSSVSGGTDIMAAFADASPVLPVYRGELQSRSLGMAVEVFNDAAESVVNTKGELVCTRPFPSMPLGFWNDRGDERYL